MAKELDMQSRLYDVIEIVPAAAGVAGEVLQVNNLVGALFSDISAAQVVLGESRALQVNANICTVVKTAAQAWTAGQPIYFDPATGAFTTVKGILQCVGYVYEAALAAAVSGSIILTGTPQAGNGMLTRSGMAAVTGSSLSIDTGLTLIVEAFVSIKDATQAATAAAYATYDHGADGLLDIYCWDDAGVAAVLAADVAWMALGS
jgi:predicted RecA/RadA family phage recombinase